ncbi:hypothetical protein DL93DRAFT_397583 [Clavulina sp. PMI_390]|nr:hypothetical protein DL93DRAFT_397583 [Clavulina sp. PMI_390]
MAATPPSHWLSIVKEALGSHGSLGAAISMIEANESLSLTLEAILCLCAGAPCPSNITPPISPADWNNARARLQTAFEAIQPNSGVMGGAKRPRDDDAAEASNNNVAPKKAKLVIDDPADEPIFTLHNVSFTSPIRKKADITVHKLTLRFTDPKDSKSNLCDPIALPLLRHAFMVSTPGKAKPHWTTMILPENPEHPSVIFGCDATLATPQVTTKYPSPPETHAKGSVSKPLIHSLFAYFPSGPTGLVDLYEPKASDFQSGTGLGQCVVSYIGPKDGHLHFFSNGILWGEKKPCIWFPVEKMTDVHPGVSSGRTFTLYISTKKSASSTDEDDITMHDFTLIDGKEDGPIRAWIAAHKAQFAIASAAPGDELMEVDEPSTSASSSKAGTAAPKTGGTRAAPARSAGPVRLMDAVLDENDEEDDDFVGSGSDSDDSGGDSSSEEGEGNDDEDEEAGEGGSDDAEDADGDADEQEEEEEEEASGAPRPGTTTDGETGADELEEEEYHTVQLPPGIKVSHAAAAAAHKMLGEAFGVP